MFAKRSSAKKPSPAARCLGAAFLACVVFSVSAARAQDVYSPSQEVPPVIVPNSEESSRSAAGVPVTIPLNQTDIEQGNTPMRALTNALGGERPDRSSVYSNLRFSGQYASQNADSTFNLLGSANLLLTGRRGETILMYSGGDEFHSKLSDYDATFHRVMFSQTLKAGRWNFGVTDQFDYLPGSPYGTYSYGGIQTPISDLLLQLAQGSLMMKPARRYDNNTMVSVDRVFGNRWIFHSTAGYGFLDFPDISYVSYRSAWASAGLKRHIRRDTVSLDGTSTLTRFGSVSAMRSFQLLAKYAHTFGRRYTLELGAGPELTFYFANRMEQRRMLVDGRASLTWAIRRGYAMLVYNRGSGNGGGVLQGAEVDDLQLAYFRPIARVWRVGYFAGWNRSSNISTLVSPLLPTAYSSAYAGVNVERNLGRTISFFLNYSFRYQMADQVLAMQPIFRNHVLLAGFYWKPRPLAIH